MNRTTTWINKFSLHDRKHMLDLISNFQVIPLSTMIDDLFNETRYHIRNDKPFVQVVMIESIISTEDARKYFKTVRKDSQSRGLADLVEIRDRHWDQVKEYFGTKKDSRKVYRAYSDYFPSQARTVDSGSEHFTDIIKRQLREDLAGRNVAPQAKINIIEAVDARFSELEKISVFLLVDNIGSGKQAASFLLSTVYGLERKLPKNSKANITIITWCATNLGVRRLNRIISSINTDEASSISFKIRLIFLNYTRTLDDAYLPADREAAKTALRVASQGVSSEWVLGFEGTASLTIFEGMTCPNTTPGIFFISKSKVGALFQSKYVPKSFHQEIRDFPKHPSLSQENNQLTKFETLARKKNILLGLRAAYALNDSKFQVLAHLALETNRMVALAHCPGLRAEQLAMEQNFKETGWIDQNSKVLEPGIIALKNYGRINRYKIDDTYQRSRNKRIGIDSHGFAYYPVSIDGVR